MQVSQEEETRGYAAVERGLWEEDSHGPSQCPICGLGSPDSCTGTPMRRESCRYYHSIVSTHWTEDLPHSVCPEGEREGLVEEEGYS